MENEERILATADIQYKRTRIMKIVKIAAMALVAASLIIGLLCFGTGSHYREGWTVDYRLSPAYGKTVPSHHYTYVSWFGVELYDDGGGWRDYPFFGREWAFYTDVNYLAIILIAVGHAAIFVAPMVYEALAKHTCKSTTLVVTDSQISGSYIGGISKKSLKMPLEKVDNLMIVSNKLASKFREGAVLGIHSTAGMIRIPFVLNAEEVVIATMERIEEIKEKEARARVVAQAVMPLAAATTADKLKDLVSMKEQGLITEEEFNKKREEILSQM